MPCSKAFCLKSSYCFKLYRPIIVPYPAIFLAFTDVAGDGRTKSFGEQWDEGLVDETIYRDDNGELLLNSKGQPLTSEDMKNPENVNVTSEAFSKFMTNVMGNIGGFGMPQKTVDVVAGSGKTWGAVAPSMVGNKFQDLSIELPDPQPGEVRSGKSIANTKLNKEVNQRLARGLTKGAVESMSEAQAEYLKNRSSELAKSKSGKATNFIKSLPGGDYYQLLKQIHEWRRKDLTPSELIKKYSK